jgi:hypothetical protein
MNEPTPNQLRAIEREFASAFPHTSADSMTPAGFDRLAEALSRVAPCGHVIKHEDDDDAGGFSVSMESYDALQQDYRMALDRRNRAESQVTNLRGKLATAHWLLCIAYVLAAVLIAARIGGM